MRQLLLFGKVVTVLSVNSASIVRLSPGDSVQSALKFGHDLIFAMIHYDSRTRLLVRYDWNPTERKMFLGYSMLTHLGQVKPDKTASQKLTFLNAIGESPVHWRLHRDKL